MKEKKQKYKNIYGVDDKFVSYPIKVLNGDIVAGKLVKLACKRYLSFFSRKDLFFDEDKADKPVRFIAKLKHWQGSQFVGKPFVLQDWQAFLCHAIYGWHRKDTGKRLTRYAYIQVSRKCGKTSLCSALCLYALMADNEAGAEVDVVAPSREQSRISFKSATNYAKSINRHSILKFRGNDISFNATNSRLRIMSSDANFSDGFNPSFALLDEYHAFKDNDIYNLLVSGQGMREQPLMIAITTAGFNLYAPCYEYRQMCVDILRGTKTDDTIFSLIYELDEGDDINDKTTWKKCCPALDITVSAAFMQDQLTKAKNNPSDEVAILTKTFNKWCKSQQTWLPESLLLKNSQKLTLEWLKEHTDSYGYIGVDLASVSDLSAVTLLLKSKDKYYTKTWVFCPEIALEESVNKELYKTWRRMGYLNVTGGDVQDYDAITQLIMEIDKVIPIVHLGYDTWNATQWAIQCTEAGMPMNPYSQSLGSFNRPTKEFERLLKSGKIVLDDNPCVRWMFSNATIKTDPINENCKPVKSGNNPNNKIDGVISNLMALGIYLWAADVEPNMTVL